MGFELFTKWAAATAGQPSVSIQKKGVLGLNIAAYAALGEPPALQLLYDRERRVIGLRAAEPDADAAYPVRSNSKGTTHLVTGTAFTKHYGIPTDSGRRYPAEMRGDLLCIDLGVNT